MLPVVSLISNKRRCEVRGPLSQSPCNRSNRTFADGLAFFSFGIRNQRIRGSQSPQPTARNVVLSTCHGACPVCIASMRICTSRLLLLFLFANHAFPKTLRDEDFTALRAPPFILSVWFTAACCAALSICIPSHFRPRFCVCHFTHYFPAQLARPITMRAEAVRHACEHARAPALAAMKSFSASDHA
jgi:hypothetical protein